MAVIRMRGTVCPYAVQQKTDADYTHNWDKPLPQHNVDIQKEVRRLVDAPHKSA